MEITVTKKADAVILKVDGRMDASTSPEFDRECGALMDAGERSLIVDFGGLEYISSAGLRSLLAAAKKLKGLHGQIRLCRMGGLVQEVFALSGFASMFSIYQTVEEALA